MKRSRTCKCINNKITIGVIIITISARRKILTERKANATEENARKG
jgi:hypothetical protein